jgi:ankyrin repeat protein
MVKLLLVRGVDPEGADYAGETALGVAARHGDAELVDLLVQNGASLDPKDAHGVTPLLRALHEGQDDAARRLIEMGAEVNAKAESGWTPLLVAVGREDEELVGLLLEKGASPGERIRLRMSSDEDTAELREIVGLGKKVYEFDLSPLAYAAIKDNVHVAARLLDAGADKNEELPNGNTLLKEATLTGRTQMMELLMQHDASS